MELLVAALAAAMVITLYDTLVSGPPFARVMLTAVVAGPCYIFLDERTLAEDIVGAAAASFIALLLLAVLQWILVQRDAAMTSVLRRR